MLHLHYGIAITKSTYDCDLCQNEFITYGIFETTYICFRLDYEINLTQKETTNENIVFHTRTLFPFLSLSLSYSQHINSKYVYILVLSIRKVAQHVSLI